jgi:hypothetical protein
MKQGGGNCALIYGETLTFDDRKLLPARNSSYSVKCLSRIFQVHDMHGVHGVHIQ